MQCRIRSVSNPNRDLRLDFFRGVALWLIFIDHVPSSTIGNLTLRNLGFSDATEIFVFISGYTATLVYGASLERQGAAYMVLQVLKRCWQLYAAHILVFVFYIAQIFWVSNRFADASIIEELNVTEFLTDPSQSMIQGLLLRYRPANLDVLPLYMVLLLVLPLILWIARYSRVLLLVVSLALWLLVQVFKWTFPVYEDGSVWFFNPLGWQLLFVVGVLCALARGEDAAWLRWKPWFGALAGIWLLFALIVSVGWRYPAMNAVIEPYVENWLYPIDKTNLGEARFLHFMSLAYLVAHWLRPDAAFLNTWLASPVIRCGQHSLYVFCVGICLSFVAHAILVYFGRGMGLQVAVIAGGLALMSALAYQLHWFRLKAGERPVRGTTSLNSEGAQ